MAIKDIRAEELREMIKTNGDKLEIIDVREKSEYDIIRIKGSKLIPVGQIQGRTDEIDWNKEVIFICRSGSRSRLAALLTAQGKDASNLVYGIYECFADGKGENLEIDESMIGRYF